jgi:hypothetical protein
MEALMERSTKKTWEFSIGHGLLENPLFSSVIFPAINIHLVRQFSIATFDCRRVNARNSYLTVS